MSSTKEDNRFTKEDNHLFVDHTVTFMNADQHGVDPFSLTFEEERMRDEMVLIAKNDKGQYIKGVFQGKDKNFDVTEDKLEAQKLKISRDPQWQQYVIEEVGEEDSKKRYWGVRGEWGLVSGDYGMDGSKWIIDWEHMNPEEYTGLIKLSNNETKRAIIHFRIELVDKRFEHEVYLKSVNENLVEGDYVKEYNGFDPNSHKSTKERSEARVFIISKRKKGGYSLSYKDKPLFLTHIGANNVMKEHSHLIHNHSAWTLNKIKN